MRSQQFCILTTADSRAKILRQENAFNGPPWLRLLSVLGSGSFVCRLYYMYGAIYGFWEWRTVCERYQIT